MRLDRDDVALPDAEITQARRHVIDPVRELAVGEPVRAVGRRLAIGCLAHAPRQHRRQALVAHSPAPRQRAAIAGVNRVSNVMSPHAAMICPPSTCSTLPVIGVLSS